MKNLFLVGNEVKKAKTHLQLGKYSCPTARTHARHYYGPS